MRRLRPEAAAWLLRASSVALMCPSAARAAVLILDNTSPGFAAVSGPAWGTSTTQVGFYGTSYSFKSTSDSPAGQVEWRPTFPQAGSYEVAVWYNTGATPATIRADDAHYTVEHALGSTPVTISQQTRGSRWVVLGVFSFAAGSSAGGRLLLSSQSSQPASNRSIIADAVRFQTLPTTFTESGETRLGGLALDARSASLADIDNDTDLDLMFQTTSVRALLRNNLIAAGIPDFTDISSLMNPPGSSSWSAAWGDYDGDGDVDVFVGQTNNDPVTGALLRNDGQAGLNEVSFETGLNDAGFHQNVAWCDIDRDGDLDLLIAMEGPERHQVYLQGPPQHFTPVGQSVGFQVAEGIKAYGMAVGDTDGDGDDDVYISTCRSNNNIRNNFFRNMLVENGVLSFIDIADSNGTQYFRNSYNAEFLDFDDDGDLDLFVIGADGEASKIWRNDGNNLFTDADAIVGHPLLTDTGGDFNGGRAVDYDNDGDLDLFFHDHLVVLARSRNHARLLYRNDGNWSFTDVTTAEGLDEACITNSNAGYDSAWADIDRDGDLDLVATAGALSGFPQPQRLFLSNVSANGHHWLYVRLRGTSGNSTAIGARLYATVHLGTPQERTYRRDANTNAGTFHQSDLPVHFGLGSAAQVDRLVIVWPDGVEHAHFSLPADQYLTISIFPRSDFDRDLDVDGDDLDHLLACRTRANLAPVAPGCGDADYDGDGDSDPDDFGVFQRCVSGSGVVQAAAPCLTAPIPQ